MRKFSKIYFCEFRKTAFAILMLASFLGCNFFAPEKQKVIIPANYKVLLKHRTSTLYGGSGKYLEDAIIVSGALNEMHATEAIQMFLEQKFPGFVVSDKKLIKQPDGIYDCWELYVEGGRKEKVYFNITEFYAK